MKCQSCDKNKSRLHNVDSSLIKGMSLILCTDCKNKGFEPRHIIIIASASGIDVSRFVVDKLYEGDPLRANEVIHSL